MHLYVPCEEKDLKFCTKLCLFSSLSSSRREFGFFLISYTTTIELHCSYRRYHEESPAATLSSDAQRSLQGCLLQ